MARFHFTDRTRYEIYYLPDLFYLVVGTVDLPNLVCANIAHMEWQIAYMIMSRQQAGGLFPHHTKAMKNI